MSNYFFNLMAIGGTAGLVAEMVTMPIDTMKVRLQVF